MTMEKAKAFVNYMNLADRLQQVGNGASVHTHNKAAFYLWHYAENGKEKPELNRFMRKWW